MATEVMHHDIMAHEQEATMGVVAGGSIAAAVGGIGAVVLAILGLVGLLPDDMAAIAAIAIGVGLLLESTAVATRLHDLLSETEKSFSSAAKLGGGMGVEFLGGVAGGVLGLLALLGIAPKTMTAIAVIVFGASLLLSSGATYQLDVLATRLGQNTPHATRALRLARADYFCGQNKRKDTWHE